MRIAMLSWRLPDDPRAGGAETLTFEVLRRCVERGHEVTWFAARPPVSPSEEVVEGIRYVRRGRQWTVQLHAWRWLRRRAGSFDVVVDQINTLPFLTPLYIAAPKRRMFIHQTAREYWWHETRGFFRALAPLGFALEPWTLRAYRSTRVITVSGSTRAELVALGVPPESISVVPMLITTPPVAELAAKEAPLRLIVVGRLTPAKFVDEALAAFALVRAHVPDARLEVVGSGDRRYQARLAAEVERDGLSAAVSFHGRVAEARKAELLGQAHVHLFASHREGWGMTVSEAGARGTPSVGYDAPGVRDSIADPRLLAPLGEGPAGLARRVLELAADPGLYAEVRQTAWQAARALSAEATTVAFLEALGD
jgi:glycosyltransferase involved in cell wall biosynthesis